MTAVDPRERVIQAGNELLDAIYESEQLAPLLDAAKERIEAGTDPGDARSVAGLVIGALTAQARRADALKQYLTVRELVESFDAAEAARRAGA